MVCILTDWCILPFEYLHHFTDHINHTNVITTLPIYTN